MNWKKEVRSIVLRSLALFLAFWLVVVLILTARNFNSMKSEAASQFDSPYRTTLLNVQERIKDGTAEELDGWLAWQMIPRMGFQDAAVGVCAVYDPAGGELAHSPISYGQLAFEGRVDTDAYLMFDAVLSEEEQIALAKTLQKEWEDYSVFEGTASGNINFKEGWPNQGLYGVVTGILDGKNLYPQKLTFFYEDRTVTMVDSAHEMFKGAELTTVRFDCARIGSTLNSRYRSPEAMLKLYCQADAAIRSLGVTLSPNSGKSVYVNNGRCVTEVDGETGVPYVWAYVYDPVAIATYGLVPTYISTFLVALIAAILVARGQIKTLKKERQFTRAVAHELKTPAAVLRATAEALSEGAAPERQAEYLSSMVEESDRLAILVNELLDLSRLEGSAAALKRQSVDLTALTEGTFERLRKPMKQHGLVLAMDLQQVTVSGDPKRLEQAVSNLAVNVLEHAQEGPVTVLLKEQNGRAVLTVSNCCMFITEGQLKRLWEPFYKVDGSRSGIGSGLGLAVVKNVVTLHGGTCSVRTPADRIEFRVELPTAAKEG